MQPLQKTVWRSLKKLKIELPHDPANALLGIYLKKTKKTKKTLIRKDTHIQIFIKALLTIVKIWKQPKCPSITEWIKNMWYIYIYLQWNTTKP